MYKVFFFFWRTLCTKLVYCYINYWAVPTNGVRTNCVWRYSYCYIMWDLDVTKWFKVKTFQCKPFPNCMLRLRDCSLFFFKFGIDWKRYVHIHATSHVMCFPFLLNKSNRANEMVARVVPFVARSSLLPRWQELNFSVEPNATRTILRRTEIW